MTATIHRILMTIGSIAAGLGGIVAMPDFEPLGIPAEAGAILALVSAVVMLVGNTIRANFPVE